MAVYVMSIKKEYGMNLLELKSLWEYRRRKSKISVGDKIILYAVAPDSELIGEFIVGGILTGTSHELWEKTKEDICYKKEEVISYLESGNFPIAFRVSNPRTYDPPVSIDKIPFFRPPMSYCKASTDLLSLLESL
ncbi:hypothetical protein J4229_01205 [Candidatus Pacearchaeota archaeon]|nr:hypothetical protein [Candidatus Pacearchaeota archaeon]